MALLSCARSNWAFERTILERHCTFAPKAVVCADAPARDEAQLRSVKELLLDDRSAVGADAAPPQLQH
jgi:hypothetical protein